MDKITKPQVDGYFGLCPECHKNDGYLDVSRDQWFYCEEHKVKWWAGSNLFSSWCEQTEEGKQENIKFLEGCKIVEPIWPANTEVDPFDGNTGADFLIGNVTVPVS